MIFLLLIITIIIILIITIIMGRFRMDSGLFCLDLACFGLVRLELACPSLL